MNILAIPKEITKGEELVVIPRKMYERLLSVLKKKSQPSTSLNKGLQEALEDVEVGRLLGPFTSLSAGLKALKQGK